MKKILAISILSLFLFSFFSCHDAKRSSNVTTATTKAQWVDSIYNNMSVKEKVGQLFMVATYSNRTDSHLDSIQKLIKDHGIGGLIFFQGGPVRQAELTNTYQAMSKVPLLIGMDAEWGLNMRLDSTSGFPYNMTLGAIKNDDIIKRIGQQIGKHCKRLGVHLNFAPVVDINTNSNNPIIGVRSFGEDKLNVTSKSLAFTHGLQSEGVLACAKHFPGHGDTDTDSHKALPTVSFSKERIDSVELYPFKKLFEKQVGGVMVAHLNVPSLEPIEGLPSSLSYNIVTNILKEQLDFKGLVFTDALNMKGVANYKEPGDVDLAAFKAGNDVLLFTENAPKAILKITEAYDNNEITEARLSHSVKKILAAKYDVDLNKFQPIEINGLIDDLNGVDNLELNKEAISNAITVIKNEDDIFTKDSNNKEKIAFLKLGDGASEAFVKELGSGISVYNVAEVSEKELLKNLKKYDKIIIGYHRLKYRDTKVISEEDKAWIEKVAETNKVILNVFASQYCLKDITLKNIEGIIMSYENTDVSQSISAQIILGKQQAYGELPASFGTGL
ncbi:glycoside hydrolase family 3 protein [Algibacter miyuki]|uniref:beta-N-acetylhexosaminidase n=1 Tax=Algibacter miyuki TaxID=1306933 RepID=A0ABV5H0N4_9FLAO|nr:glycoside hydrolase family 3 N-terminal domain-containing protein [Algibacter miyuki]MDN3666933.1 glycoside hydrolase family 3 N-terminal domain-containing protein [Algibacter miyuki]